MSGIKEKSRLNDCIQILDFLKQRLNRIIEKEQAEVKNLEEQHLLKIKETLRQGNERINHYIEWVKKRDNFKVFFFMRVMESKWANKVVFGK